MTRLLEQHFARLVDYEFTAAMEDDLDAIAAGDEDRVDWLRELLLRRRTATATRACTTLVARPRRHRRPRGQLDPDRRRASCCGSAATAPTSRTRRGDAAASDVPDDLRARRADAREGAGAARRRRPATACSARTPRPAREIVAKNGRYGPYVTEVLPEDARQDASKPRTGSLFKSMSLDTVTLDDALKLLSLPRVVGVDPRTGEEITAQNGRYGPYLKKGTDSRSLETEEQLFTITLEEALAIYAQPKQRGRGRGASRRCKELGNDPVSEQADRGQGRPLRPVRHRRRDQRHAPQGDDAETITVERAAELLAERRAKGPAPKRSAAAAAALLRNVQRKRKLSVPKRVFH